MQMRIEAGDVWRGPLSVWVQGKPLRFKLAAGASLPGPLFIDWCHEELTISRP